MGRRDPAGGLVVVCAAVGSSSPPGPGGSTRRGPAVWPSLGFVSASAWRRAFPRRSAWSAAW